MINLLPGDVKEQVSYSKRNRTLINYLRLAVLTTIICGGFIGYGFWALKQQSNVANKALAGRRADVAKYKTLETDAKNVNARIAAIKSIQKTQSHFSTLLEDLGKVTPPNVVISSIALTGDDKKPVSIAGTTNSLSAVAAFHDALEQKAPRISGADIQNVGRDEKGNYSFSISIGFKPGAAK